MTSDSRKYGVRLGPKFDDPYGALYLPLVFLTFVPIAAWLLLGEGEND